MKKPKINPEWRNAIPSIYEFPIRYTAFNPNMHDESERSIRHPDFVEVARHVFDGVSWIPNPEFETAEYEESLI